MQCEEVDPFEEDLGNNPYDQSNAALLKQLNQINLHEEVSETDFLRNVAPIRAPVQKKISKKTPVRPSLPPTMITRSVLHKMQQEQSNRLDHPSDMEVSPDNRSFS